MEENMAVKRSKKVKAENTAGSGDNVVLSLADSLGKKYGKLKIFTEKQPLESNEFYSTGIIALDDMLGGGVAKGKMIEISGPESAGKTSFTLSIAAEAQKQGQKVAFIDAEQSLDRDYAKNIGYDVDQSLVIRPENGNDALNAAREIVESGQFGLVIIDSTAALVHENELAGDIGDSHMALQARLIGQGVRMMNFPVAQTGTTVIFISQERANMNVGPGAKKNTTGGNALKFYTSQRLSLVRTGSFTSGDTKVGNTVKVRAIKNKTGGAQFAETEVSIRFGQGYCRYFDLIDIAIKEGIVQKAGAWFSYGEGKLGQGKEACRRNLMENPELFKEIKDKIYAKREEEKQKLAELIQG